MKTRVISGLIMAPFLLIVVLGGYPLMAAAVLIGIVGLKEFYNGFRAMDVKPCYPIGVAAVAVLYAMNVLTGTSGIHEGNFKWHMLWVFGVVLASMLYLFKIDERKLEDGMATMTGVLYVVFFSYHVVLIDQGGYPLLVWLVLITAFVTDIMAYFSGYFFGKHKLCPKISPKKTIEGSIGGTLGTMIVSGLFGYFVMPEIMVHCMIMGALGAVFSQFGDLTASIFKRKMGIKDYGHLIPGHGGILDRFDSVLFTAPLIYYYIIFVLA